jgi:magnesium transporter
MVVPADSPQPAIRVMEYGPDHLDERDVDRGENLRDFGEVSGRTLWIDVTGFGDEVALAEIGEALGIHPLAMADVVHVPQRPKAELYDERLLMIAQMARVTEAGGIDIEQVSLVLGPNWVASFQEQPGTCSTRCAIGFDRPRHAFVAWGPTTSPTPCSTR